MKRQRWTEAEQARLRQLWEAGQRLDRIADEIGKSRSAILGQRYRLNLAPRSLPELDGFETQASKLGQLYTEGLPIPRIAQILHLKKEVVAARIRRAIDMGDLAERSIDDRRAPQDSRRALPPPAEVATGVPKARPVLPLARRCQWIETEPTKDDSCKCGAPVRPGSAYCDAHHARVWLPETRRRKEGRP